MEKKFIGVVVIIIENELLSPFVAFILICMMILFNDYFSFYVGDLSLI